MKDILINDSSENSIYQISLEQKVAIEKGRNEIIKGLSIKNEATMIEMKQWLKSRSN